MDTAGLFETVYQNTWSHSAVCCSLNFQTNFVLSWSHFDLKLFWLLAHSLLHPL